MYMYVIFPFMNLLFLVHGISMPFQILTNFILFFCPHFIVFSSESHLSKQASICIGFQVHVVDGSSPQPDLEFDAVRLELKLFSPELAEKPYIVAYNKMDLPEAYENWESFEETLQSQGITPFCMSAVKGEGTHEVICAAYELLRKSKEDKEEYEGYNSVYTYSKHYCHFTSYF